MYGDLGLKLIQNAKRTQKLPYVAEYQADLVQLIVRETRELDEANSHLQNEARNRHEARKRSQSEENSRYSYSIGGSTREFDLMEFPDISCGLLVHHLAMRRNKRCLLAYQASRIERLERLCWSGWDVYDILQMKSNMSGGNMDGMIEAKAGEATIQMERRRRDRENFEVGEFGRDDGEWKAKMALSPEEVEFVHKYTETLAGLKGEWMDIDITGSLPPPRELFVDVRVLRDAGEIQTEFGTVNLSKDSQFFIKLSDVERLIQQGYVKRI